MHEIVYQKVERLFFSLKVWWDETLVRFDEMTFSSSLMRWRFRQVWWDDVFFVKFDESLSSSLMSRSRQAWWVVSLQVWWDASSSLTSHHKRRSTDREQTYVIRWSRMSMRHSSKSEIRRSEKNWRWDDQAWSREWIISNNLCKRQIWIAFLRSHLTFRDKTQKTLLTYFRSKQSQYSLQQVNLHQRKFINSYSSQQWIFYKISSSRERKKLLRAKKLIIVMFSKKNNSQIKRLFSFIIVCFLRSTNTIQSFREIRRRNRFILRNFHYTHQDFIAARQKDLELDFDYNFSFKLFSSIISNQFFRKFILDF
jgi:hypothetical protein